MPLKPPKLQKGQTIGVIAPASPADPERLTQGIRYLESLGYQVKPGQHLRKVYGYLAGGDRARLDDLNRMFADDEVHAVFCTRGGYGTVRLLDFVDYECIKENPKLLVGYSDITALQLALFRKTGLITLSGPMVAAEMGRGIEDFTERHFWSLVTKSEPAAKFSGLKRLKPGIASGRLLGGNLSLLCTLIGTPYLPDLRGSVLFIEDVGEQPYQIDRKLMQLRLSGVFSQVSGVVFGHFKDCTSDCPEDSLGLDEVLQDVFQNVDIPVASGLLYGHVDKKYTLPQGVEVILNAQEGYMEMQESPVV
ncbi:MAG: LD-carboxypeptidase [bacterium]